MITNILAMKVVVVFLMLCMLGGILMGWRRMDSYESVWLEVGIGLVVGYLIAMSILMALDAVYFVLFG